MKVKLQNIIHSKIKSYKKYGNVESRTF